MRKSKSIKILQDKFEECNEVKGDSGGCGSIGISATKVEGQPEGHF